MKIFPDDSQARKELPVCRGVIDYFPDAIAAVSHVSHVGNQQHNPGQPLHWAKHKSIDHADCILRHLMERGGADSDGVLHSAKLAWRALALLQIEIEAQRDADFADLLAEKIHESGPPLADTEHFPPVMGIKAESVVLDEFASLPADTIAAGKRIVKADDLRLLAPPPPALAMREDVPPEVDRDYRFSEDQLVLHTTEVLGGIERDVYSDECGCDHCQRIRAAKPVSYFPHLDPRSLDEQAISENVHVTGIETSTPRCYIVGPMTGYEQFNFPAFDEALERLTDLGWDAISPANLDRQAGIDPNKLADPDAYVEKFTAEDLKKIIRRDVRAILSLDPERDSLALLPGWEASTGSVAETMLGRWLGLPLMDTFGRRIMGSDVDYPVLCTSIYNYLQGKAGLR